MSAIFAYLKEFNFLSVVVRLILAIACGAVVGIGRSKKKQNAGLGTYVLTAIGAATLFVLAIVLLVLGAIKMKRLVKARIMRAIAESR